MRSAVLLLAVFLLASCAHRRTPFRAVHVLARVTAANAYTSGNLPRRYARVHDLPGQKWVLWSYERMCVVDPETWVRVRVGDQFSCEWRSPR